MKIDVVWKKRVYQVEVLGETGSHGSNSFRIRLGTGGNPVSDQTVRLLSRTAGRWTLECEGKVEDLVLTREADGLLVDHRNRLYRFAVQDLRNRLLKEALEPEVSGPVQLKAQMPGRIIRLLKRKGDEVETGQGVVVIEAMKMQNEVRSPRGGTVRAILVREGDLASAGTVLAEID